MSSVIACMSLSKFIKLPPLVLGDDAPPDREQVLSRLAALERLLDEIEVLVRLVAELFLQLPEVFVGVLGPLFPAPGLLLELELLHWIVGQAGRLACFLLFGAVLADLALVLGLP